MRVSVVGIGRVGLITAACLAEVGHEVTCAGVGHAKQAPFHERGLPELLAAVNLAATQDLGQAVRASELTMICADPSDVESVAAHIGNSLRGKESYHVVVVRSTVVPGTTEKVILPLLEKHSGKRAGEDFGVGVNPEFFSDDASVDAAREPDRIVLGGIDERTWGVLVALYQPWDDIPTLLVGSATAEMIKFASVAWRATVVSFANEMAELAGSLGGVDIADVEKGLHASYLIRDAPVRALLQAGSADFPADLAAFAAFGVAQGLPLPVTTGVLAVDRAWPGRLVELLGDVNGKRVAVLGLSVRPGTDNVHESPALRVIDALRDRGATTRAVDPLAHVERVDQVATLEEALDGAEAVVLVTAWPEFARVPALLKGREVIVADGRRMWRPGQFADYRAIGLS